MANKYIVHGAAFNGDGTSSAEATVNGGAGAWNNINIFQGTAPTYGTLAAGDVVYIRSKSAAGADISVTTGVAMSIGSAAATETEPITWVIDHGVVWPGVSGTVRYDGTDRIAITIRDWNNIKAKDYNMVFGNTLTTVVDVCVFTFGTGWTEDVMCDLSVANGVDGPYISYKSSTHVRLWVRSRRRYRGVFRVGAMGPQTLTLYSPEIELLDAGELDGVFWLDGGLLADPVTVYGGRVFGPGAVVGAPLVTGSYNCGAFRSFGLAYPREMPLCLTSFMTSVLKQSVYADGADGEFGSEYMDPSCHFTSRSDNNPPTLNATLETSSGQGWSYRLYPYAASSARPARLSVSKTWTQAPAAQKIIQEILWPVAMGTPSKNGVYMVVQYVEATTGVPKTISTREVAGGALTSSSAPWSATTWGMVNLAKYKLSVDTPTPIKQDTAVLVTLFVASRSATVNDVLFVDPDPTFSAP